MYVSIWHCGHDPGLAFLTVILLACSGVIETNPGPNSRTSNQDRYSTFCHANMGSIKKCSDKLDHNKADFCGVYDVITKWSVVISRWQLTILISMVGHYTILKTIRILSAVTEVIVRRRWGTCMSFRNLGFQAKAWSGKGGCGNSEIRCSNNKVLLSVVYRTNEQVNFWDALQECYNKALAIGLYNIIITGDLNAETFTINGEIWNYLSKITI